MDTAAVQGLEMIAFPRGFTAVCRGVAGHISGDCHFTWLTLRAAPSGTTNGILGDKSGTTC